MQAFFVFVLCVGPTNAWVTRALTPIKQPHFRQPIVRVPVQTSPFEIHKHLSRQSSFFSLQAAKVDGVGEFEVGQRVGVAWPTKLDAEYPARVHSCYPDGTFAVIYSLDDTWEQVSADRLTPFVEFDDSQSFIRPLPGEPGWVSESSSSEEGGSLSAEEEEATLSEYRAQATRSNDNWQFSCFGNAHGVASEVGEWFGLVQEWRVEASNEDQATPATFDLVEIVPPSSEGFQEGEDKKGKDPKPSEFFSRLGAESLLGRKAWKTCERSLKVDGEEVFFNSDSPKPNRREAVTGATRSLTLTTTTTTTTPATTTATDAATTDVLSLAPSDFRAEKGKRSLKVDGEEVFFNSDSPKPNRREAVTGTTRSLTLTTTTTTPATTTATDAATDTTASATDVLSLAPSDFRAEKGNQVCGNTFALAGNTDNGGGSSGRIEVEVAIRSGASMLSLVVAYAPPTAPASTPTAASTLVLRGVQVRRFSLDRWPDPVTDLDLFGPPGQGLYDNDAIPKGAPSLRYRFLPLAGNAAAAVPLELEAGVGGTVSLDWDVFGSEIRFQVDRKFGDGAQVHSISSLEVTEMLSQRSPPPKGGGSFPPRAVE
eukprot:CAMPEP_0171984312 /NCGR_PEP_ID=MMETSP0993-20121228/273760_1 /TAXON_ID=483369 /ORGANISM="non described non described, Strain CCMP2098" /LENGTH=595 /DNA_ID=CAMNT_0012637123 /DNA_START=110 /DNA_END=1897 /DNA_ORIENTATION=-